MVPGAGAFQVAVSSHLTKFKETVKGRAKMGIQAFADAMLIIPKVLAKNGGFDSQDTIVALQVKKKIFCCIINNLIIIFNLKLQLQEEYASGHIVGVDLNTGETLDPIQEGILDNYRVIRNMLHSW